MKYVNYLGLSVYSGFGFVLNTSRTQGNTERVYYANFAGKEAELKVMRFRVLENTYVEKFLKLSSRIRFYPLGGVPVSVISYLVDDTLGW